VLDRFEIFKMAVIAMETIKKKFLIFHINCLKVKY